MSGNFKQPYIIFTLLSFGCILLLLLILLSISRQSIYIWDEAIYANNALEMAQHQHYFVYTNNGVSDHYNSKPPLMLWLQALSFSLFSFNEFALRLPTFIALLGILFLFFQFIKKLAIPFPIFIIASFILLTTQGAIRPHVFLTGDLDGLLVFFTTALYFIYLEQVYKRTLSNRSIVLFFLFLLGGYFTKSTAILLTLPSILIGYCYEGMLRAFLKNKMIYILFSLCCIIIATYYVVREQYDPGYLQVVWESEVTRYFSSVMSWHNQPFIFYFNNIMTQLNTFYTILTLIVIIPYLLIPTFKYKSLVLQCLLLCIVFLFTISIPTTKLEWYDAPVYPIWTFALAVMMFELCQWAYTRLKGSTIYQCCFTILISSFAVYLSWHICQAELLEKRNYQPQEVEAALLKKIDQQYNKNRYTVLMDVDENKLHHFDALNFYIKSFELNQHKTIHLKRSLVEIKPNDTLIVCQQNKLDSLQAIFSLNKLSDNYLVILHKK